MAQVPIISSGTSTVGAGASNYFPVVNGALLGSSTEANRTNKVRVAGTYSNIYLRVTTNTTSGLSTVRFRKNLANGNQQFSITGGATGEFEGDLVNTDTVAAGDTTSVLVIGGTGGSITVAAISCLFSATTNTSMIIGHVGQITITSASISDTQFMSLIGRAATNGNATESAAQARVNCYGTIKNLYVRVSANARTTTTTLRLRKNGNPGNLTLSIGSGATGDFEDTSNSDTVAPGDLICLSFATGTGTETLTIQEMIVEIATTDGSYIMQALGDNGTVTVADGATSFLNFGSNAASATELDFRTEMNVAADVQRMFIQVSANTCTSPSTVAIRKNGSSGNQTITIDPAFTGFLECSNPLDSFAATDEISIMAINGGGGSLTLKSITAAFNIPDSSIIKSIRRGMIVVPISI